MDGRKVTLTGSLIAFSLLGCGTPPPGAHGQRLIVLGVDGMDPIFLERHWDALPNFKRLRDRGGLRRLATTTPPQSPVAWATFITGLDPAQHGIFDFVHRDPTTKAPISSMAQTLEPAHHWNIGPYSLPLGRAQVRSFRSGSTFWEILTEHGVPVTMVRVPTNYPPQQHAGEALSGMGTPDLEGTFGTFTYYTDDPGERPRSVSGGRIVPVVADAGRVVMPIEGPVNVLRRDRRATSLDMVADIDPEAAVARFQVGAKKFILREGEWSGWIPVGFPLIAGVHKVSGMFRIYARQLHPAIHIYRSPLNINPEDPALPVSSPPEFGRDMAHRIGSFYTQGIEEDTSALRQGALDLHEYLQQSHLVANQHRAMLRDCLNRFHEGLLFFYFSETDQDSHILWGRHDAELLETYQGVDEALGEVLQAKPDADVVVMSDHGFSVFRRAVHLNTWLRRAGFPTARALGLNALYLDEPVGAGRDALLATLERRLRDFRDPMTGDRVIQDVTRIGNSTSRYAPDLIVGPSPGYRISWETALGEAPVAELEDNTDAWIGDHCMAASAVPGALLGTLPARVADPALKDLPVTILRLFGVTPPSAMKGRDLYH